MKLDEHMYHLDANCFHQFTYRGMKANIKWGFVTNAYGVTSHNALMNHVCDKPNYVFIGCYAVAVWSAVNILQPIMVMSGYIQCFMTWLTYHMIQVSNSLRTKPRCCVDW